MISVKISARRTVYVDYVPDNGINRGGYYCQVYDNPDKLFRLNDFTLSKRDIPMNCSKELLVKIISDKTKLRM